MNISSVTDPSSVKSMVGDRLREHGTYRRLLDDEGKRCWTLEYAEQDGIGFHLDVLPSVPDPTSSLDTSIAITNKKGDVYDWSTSNPKGYGLWFERKNQAAFAFAFALTEQKRSIQARAPDIYARVDDVPDQLVRTPLQRSIQLMKRHRDIKFNNAGYNRFAPISIIITTLAAQFYQNEPDILCALSGIVTKLHAHAVLVENGAVDKSLAPYSPIKRMSNGKWYIGNPVISFLYEHGYRGHHPCPCGSGLRVRKGHGPMLRDLHQRHTWQTLMLDFEAVFRICFKKFKDGELSFPKSLKIQILRILKNGQKIQALPEHGTG